MSKNLYITTEIPSILTINGTFIDASEIKPVRYVYNENEATNGRLIVSVQPLTASDVPFAFSVSVSDKGFLVPARFGTITDCGGNNWLLSIKDIKKRFYEHGRLVFSMDFDIGNEKKDSFCVVDDSFLQLLIEHDNKVSRIFLPDTLINIRPKVEKIDNLIIFALTAQNGGKQYLFVAVSADGKDYEIKIDSTAVKIEQDGSKTMILNETDSIAKRAKVSVYDSKTFDLSEEYYAYLHGSPVLTSDPEKIPLALFEAVKSGDLKLAEQYLSPDLLKDVSVEELTDFFFDYISIAPKIIPEPQNGVFVLTDTRNTSAFYIFEIQNGLINNIKELD